MKSITDALAQHLAGDTATTSRLWKIKRKATSQAAPATAFVSGPLTSASQAQLAEGVTSGSLGTEETVGTSYAVADLADNNTSASASWTNTTSGDAAPADTSKVSIKSALYSGATTRVLAHMVGWFYSGSSHISVGYFDDATQVAKAIADMKSRGIDGVVLDWYGQGTQSDTVAGYIKAACEADGQMTFAICIDKGLSGGLTQANFESAVAYVHSTYFGSSAYEKRGGRPILLEFGCEQAAIDWNAVKAYMTSHGNPLFLWQDLTAPTGTTGISGGSQNAFAAPYTDGVFSWVGVSAVTGSDPEALGYLQNFYKSAKNFPAKIAMGSVRKGFNDALASWGSGRVMTQANGDTWADSFSTLNGYFSASLQLPFLQVVTWDDYEEGTETETGIVTNLAFGALSASGNSVSWSTTGTLKPFDHIGVYASSDGGLNYTFLGAVAKDATSVDLVAALNLASGTYKVRLRAVGISSVQSVESADVTITVSNTGGGASATNDDWEFVGGQWRTVASAPANTELSWLYASGFGFNIPSTATIIGVVASVVYSAQGVTGSYMQEVSLFNAGSPPSPIGTEKTTHLQFTPSQQTMSQGAKTDMWGLPAATLDPALVNSSTFGFGIRLFYDGVRLYVSQFSMTVYYTLPASGGVNSLTLSSSLVRHTNFTGSVEADTSADALACAAGASPVFDTDGALYINDQNGNVHKFDGAAGAYLGAIGQFGTPSVAPHYSRRSDGGGMRILDHPVYGKWLVVADGAVWGMNLQAMAIDGKDASGNAVSVGTVTNVVNAMVGGSLSSGNWDVDASGNIWVFGTDQSGTDSGKLLLKQITLLHKVTAVATGDVVSGQSTIGDCQALAAGAKIGDKVSGFGIQNLTFVTNLGSGSVSLSKPATATTDEPAGDTESPELDSDPPFTFFRDMDIVARTDLSSLFAWTGASGVVFDPASGTLVVFGSASGTGYTARVDQNAAFAVRASGSFSSAPINVGGNGQFVIVVGGAFSVVRSSDLAVIQSFGSGDYAISSNIRFVWYDAVNNFCWVTTSDSSNQAWVLDLGNPAPAGAAQLADPGNGQPSPNYVCTGALVVSPGGAYGCTNGGNPGNGFIDFWGAALESAGGVARATTLMGFTDHDLDVVYDDGSGDGPITYLARTGATFSAIESKPDMSVDNLDIESFLESDLITEVDIRGGLYDGAECTVYLVNWADLTQKHLTLRYGVFGKVKIVNGLFTTEIRGLAYALGMTLGDYYGPLCRAELFSTPQNSPNRQWYCNLNAALFQQSGSVSSSSDSYHITPNAGLIAKGGSGSGGAAPAGWFDFGLISFTSGANQNLSYQVESWDGTTLTLEFPLAAPVAPGDTFIIEPGCDKLLTTCINKFNNAINHRGEAWIPGLDAVLDMFPSE